MWQRSICVIACLLAPLVLAGAARAQIDEPDRNEARPGKELAALDLVELGRMSVEGQRLDPMDELSLRLVSWALDVDRSARDEDEWKPRCWFGKPVGSHIEYLYCATNGQLNEITTESRGVFGEFAGMGGGVGVGKGNAPIPDLTNARVVRSRFPVNRGELDRILENFGSKEMNKEAVVKVLQGEREPENLPLEHELDSFSKALSRVREIRADLAERLKKADEEERERLVAEADARMAEAIESEDLTVKRYNRISEQVGAYVSLKAAVRERLARN